MAGGSIEKLKEMLGHYSVVITERYAHLKPELFTAGDRGTIGIDLAPGEVVPLDPRRAPVLSSTVGYDLATPRLAAVAN